jgi:glycosyltransferase involved in cell wall biosynthesis
MSYDLYLEIGPLQEIYYAGISNVTLELCRYWLQQEPDKCRFFLGPYLIRRDVVELVARTRSGGLFQLLLRNGQAQAGFLESDLRSRAPATPSVALFPNVKSVICPFDYSLQIIHDLSFLLTPEFHHTDTIQYHGTTIRRDLESNAHNFCVSKATASDLITYLRVPQRDITICYPGGDSPSDTEEVVKEKPLGAPRPPFIVVPGTIEPRKNIDLIFLALKRNPILMKRYRFLFLGASGWLLDFRSRISQFMLTNWVDNGRIMWLGYVDEYQKSLLYEKAELSIYPSLFEGFGMPVVEAMSHGCPVLCSYSSSLPEAGGEAAFYFDPTSIASFEEALFSTLTAIRLKRQAIRRASLQHAKNITWEQFNTVIKNKIDSIVSANVGEA